MTEINRSEPSRDSFSSQILTSHPTRNYHITKALIILSSSSAAASVLFGNERGFSKILKNGKWAGKRMGVWKKKTSNYFKMNEDITAGLGEKFIFV